MPSLPHIDFSAPSWDLFLLLFFVIGALLYGLSLGRDRVMVIMVSIYMGLAVVTNAPYLKKLTATIAVNDMALRVGTFMGVFALLFFFLSRNALLRSVDLGTSGGLPQTLLFSVLHVGLLISVGLAFLPDAALEHFSWQSRKVFLSDAGRFVWLVAPIAAMMFFGGKGSKM
jgi:hypothetical protein